MDIYWIWLSTIPYVGPVLQKRLLKVFRTPQMVYEINENELRTVKGLNKRAVESLLHHRSLDKAKRVLDEVARTSTNLLTFDSPLYPPHAKDCSASPVVLYYRGQLKPVNEAVVVIGTRRCSDYGKKISLELAAQLSRCDVPVISGLAKGIDGYAHTACIRENGYTVAFVANGVDVCYPPEHQSLYDEIIKRGAIVSQYPPGTKPHPKFFLQRNALMAAWGSHVVVVEAGRKSGALATADFAKKYRRKLYAVPHRIDTKEGMGTNKLIEQGAIPYLGFPSLQMSQKKKRIHGNQENHSILELLQQGPVTVEQLSERLQIEDTKLIEELFSLELEGEVYIRGETILLNEKR